MIRHVPVRHHSPASADAVRRIVLEVRPAAVLVEGPWDFNPRMAELALAHRLPIAIYCHSPRPDGRRRGAYYPFCEHSPEWQAIATAREVGAAARFIDLPFHAHDEDLTHRYADARLRRSAYVDRICDALGVDDFDGAWDELFEAERLDPDEYLRRAHALCDRLREADGEVDPACARREAFMAARVGEAAAGATGPLVVVTGGYHTLAIARAVEAGAPDVAVPEPPEGAGIALTPYSYERLDRLSGYESGLPGPGFYDRAWRARRRGVPLEHLEVLQEVAARLRRLGRGVSAADLIGVDQTARALARLRGRDAVWRRDLLDGLSAVLVKDELAHGGSHPLLEAVHEVLRGDARGELAAGCARPPLVLELAERLDALDLVPGTARDVDLDLERSEDRERSVALHRCRVLSIAGFRRTEGPDFVVRGDLARLRETWRLAWSPEHDGSAVEASRHGATLAEAAAGALAEASGALERDAERGAALLVDAALAGLSTEAGDLLDRLAELLRTDADFARVATALGHLLYLSAYDRVLGFASDRLADLVAEAWRRGLWLLEALGPVSAGVDPVLRGIALLVDAFEVRRPPLPREDLLPVLARTAADGAQGPAVRGAATGALWVLGAAADASLLEGVPAFADPAQLGDWLLGVFHLAREALPRQPDLLRELDRVLLAWSDEEFLEALPALRFAFTWFTPREKHHMSRTIRQLGGPAPFPPAALEVSSEVAAAALALETALLEAARRYGVRGVEDEP